MSPREHVLLIDDDRDVAEGLALLLERSGRTTIVCSDVESAEMVLSRYPVTHVVSDVQFSGSFGFEAEHYALSMQVGRDRLFPAVDAEPLDTVLAATGVSCRQQIEHGTARRAMHPVELVRSALAPDR